MIRALIVTSCCVLASTTAASAECAWVLWGRAQAPPVDMTSPPPRPSVDLPISLQLWQPLSGYEKKVDCLNARSAGARAAFAELPTGATVTVRCLPDSVDPRGPKGGK